ncbi:MAG: hypothetical protein PWP31_1573 [Clostridia bacterium]|nr:hypothetical protein [Clostridia bacterium]
MTDKNRNKMNEQIRLIRSETDNPAIINDVVNTEFGVWPENYNDITEGEKMTKFEENSEIYC